MFPPRLRKGLHLFCNSTRREVVKRAVEPFTLLRNNFILRQQILIFFFFMCWSSLSKLQFLWQKRQSELNHISAASRDPIAYCLPTYSTCCFPLPLSITYSEVWIRKWGNSFLLFSQLTVSLWWHCNPGGGKETGTGQLHMWSKFTLKNKTEAYGLTLTARSSPEYKTALLSWL